MCTFVSTIDVKLLHPLYAMYVHYHSLSFPIGQRQNTALPNRGGVHLPLWPRQPLAEPQASLHMVRDAQGWWHWVASPSQVSPAHLNCRFSLFECDQSQTCSSTTVHIIVMFPFKQIEQLKQKADKRVRSVSTCHNCVARFINSTETQE